MATENFDWSLQEKLATRGWKFTSHLRNLHDAQGLGEKETGLTLEEIKKRNYPVVGAKGGVQLAKGHSLIIDADMPGLFEWLKENFPDTFGKTLTTKGSKLGHFYFETDRSIKGTKIDTKKGGDRAIDIIGAGGMAVMPPSPHRKIEKNYEIIDDRVPLVAPWGEIESAILSAVSHFNLYWPDMEKKNKENIQREGPAQLIKNKLTLSDIDSRLIPGLQSCPLPGHKNGDRNPSLSVSTDGKLWNCFSKHGGGDIFSYLKAKEGMEFKDALTFLSKKAGIETNSGDSSLNKYIFDENKILRTKQFVFSKLNEDVYAYGMFLPKEKEIYNKEGTFLGTEQIEAPVFITSDGKLMEISKEIEKSYKIRFECIPTRYERRWSLSSIENYLRGNSGRVSASDIFQRFRTDYEKFLYFQNERWYDVHALWDLGTYFFLLFEKYPFLELRGYRGTGKNKIMAVSRAHTLNATEEMTDPSEATLFRETHERRPTKYIDEAEKLFQIVNGRLVADDRVVLLNSSFQCTGRVPRIEKDERGKFYTAWYHTYSPLMIASINGLYGATEDRAVVHITTRPAEGDERGAPWPKTTPQTQETRDMAYLFALQNVATVERSILKTSLENAKLHDRDRDIWFPLLVLARMVSETLYKDVLEFAEKQSEIKQLEGISEDSFEFRILEAAKQILSKGKEFALISEIANGMIGEKRPSNRTIASILDKLGFREFKQHRMAGNGYAITTTLFNTIIGPLCPLLLSSSSSSSSSLVGNRMKIDEHNEDRGKTPITGYVHICSYISPTAQTCDEHNEDKSLPAGLEGGVKNQPHPSTLSLRRTSEEVLDLWKTLGYDALDRSGFEELFVITSNIGITQKGVLGGFVRQLIEEHKIKPAEGFDLEAVSC